MELSSLDNEKKLVIEWWLIKADNDLRSAHNDLSDVRPITDTACFHAQQCAEKCLKAFLAYVDEHIEKTHSLTRLVNVCCRYDEEFVEFRELLAGLTRYAVASRYLENWREIPVEEAEEAVVNAEKVMEFVKNKLNI